MIQIKGFTLIELVVVIIILGILAVTAAPKLIDLSNDARRSVLQAKVGEIKSVMNLAHSKALVSSVAKAAEATIPVEGGELGLIHGYPMPRANHSAPANSIAGITEIVTNDTWTWSAADTTTQTLNGCPDTNYSFRSSLNGAPGNCYLEYVGACTLGTVPQIITEDAGC